MKKAIPNLIDPHVIAVVGGLVDEVGITLAIYGESLEPSAITALLGVQPTDIYRRGERRSPRSPAYVQGAWLLSVRCASPVQPNDALLRLLGALPDDENLWSRLAHDYDVQLRLGVHFTGWNKGFTMAAEAISRLARMHVKIGFDLYAYGDEDAELPEDGPEQDSM
jgi:uncharacterized protein DUF4279